MKLLLALLAILRFDGIPKVYSDRLDDLAKSWNLDENKIDE